MKKILYLLAFSSILFIGCEKNDPTPEPKNRFPYQSGLNQDDEWMANYETAEIRDGKFWQDSVWRFLKIGKPLSNFATQEGCEKIKSYLDKYKELNYDVIELNCYWYQFDTNGDGTIDVSLVPLKNLITKIYSKGMFPCLSVETYAVGGGKIPNKFFVDHPEAQAVDHNGELVTDTEYGTKATVPSIFDENYLACSRAFISNLAKGLGSQTLKLIFWFETTVEPQYMGIRNLDYNDAAKKAYSEWRVKNGITDKESEMPETFPITTEFMNNDTWNKFRAQSLAGWICGDADAFKEAYKSVTGNSVYVAADYLSASASRNRIGNEPEFVKSLTSSVDIIQLNWVMMTDGTINTAAYKNITDAMAVNGCKWAVSEHMTYNGEGFRLWSEEKVATHLKGIAQYSTRFGYEFTSTVPDSSNSFATYGDDWTPVWPIKGVEFAWRGLLDYTWGIELGQSPTFPALK